MSREELVGIDDQGMAAWDAHNPEAFLDLFAGEFVWRDLTVPEEMRTRDQAKQYMQGWFTRSQTCSAHDQPGHWRRGRRM